ncbi:PAS domain S-box protein [Roseateles sp. DAIF2]|uniref:PAS domain S-box protein n=1 Tax=Roseateles sp. DAIF2 TaxID=2714952 RepID=UPI0018A2516C|nr:PAS domain S-box protein [Roseateles sp. DAIF2]QPF73143.1 PAS domain S-box protein [Roseateles sp. DAIF2]
MPKTPAQLPLLSSDLSALHGLLALLGEPVLLLDEGLQVLEANPPAKALLQAAAGQVLPQAALRDWLRLACAALLEERRPPAAPPLPLADGSRAQLHLLPLDRSASGDGARWLLHARAQNGRADNVFAGAPAQGEWLQLFAASALPACVLDGQLRLQGANPAFAELCGRDAAALRDLSLAELVASDERAALRGARPTRALARSLTRPVQLPEELHLLDAEGREHGMRLLVHALTPELNLCLLQDRTPEQAARAQAERAQAEVEQWLALSPLPMVLFDDNGLLLRANTAFAALSLAAPASLHEAGAALQRLLAWDPAEGRPLPALREQAEGAPPLLTQAQLVDPGGRSRWLAGRLQRLVGQRRYMAVLDDRSSEQERDLAHQQLDALMDTAGVGLATFQQDAGWLRPRGSASGAKPKGALAGLQGVGRDIVEPDSLPEFERLQRALKTGDRVEVRYAVRHPELGRRWLLTRVEPGQLASGQRTTSVVTLDVTAQAQAERRHEQLLRELSTIMDSSGVGMAYLRGKQLLRCNEGFEQMLGLPAATPAGTPVATLFAALPELAQQVQTALAELSAEHLFEAEFVQVGSQAPTARWLSLSLRKVQGPADEAVAVVSDISRLKAQQTQLEALVQDRELMFNLSDVGMAILRQGKVARANEALAAMSGYRIAELNGLEHRRLFDSEFDYERLQQSIQQALAQQGQWKGERRLRRRDGASLWMQVSKRVMRPGAPDEGVIATYVNVDDRWRAQQSLMLQTERERAVLDSVLVGIVTVGRGGIEWMNRSARRMFGGDLSAFAGQPMSIVATPDPDHPFRHTHYLDELTEGQAETFECRLKARDGREFWVVGNAVVTGIEESGRQLTYALLDIERRRQAEAQTQQAQASLQRIIEAAPLAISLHDAKTLAVEQINQAAAALAGRAEAELIGASPEQLFGAEQGPVVRNDMESALLSTEVTQREYRLQLHGQTRVWDARLLHLAPAQDPADPEAPSEPEQLLLVASDVTEQRAAEEARLAAAIAQRELLVREVHHRIKNNLQGVAGLLQQIAARRPEVAGVIGEAVGQVQAIAQVYGLQVGSAGPLRVRKVVEAITGSVQRLHGQPITLAIEGEQAELVHQWALPEAESIPIALTLNELLGNAFKHGGGQAPQCALVCGDNHVALRIVNQGRLPEGFQLSKVPGGVSGLGLVRALLPRRSAILSLEQQGEQVVCLLELLPPSVNLLTPL